MTCAQCACGHLDDLSAVCTQYCTMSAHTAPALQTCTMHSANCLPSAYVHAGLVPLLLWLNLAAPHISTCPSKLSTLGVKYGYAHRRLQSDAAASTTPAQQRRIAYDAIARSARRHSIGSTAAQSQGHSTGDLFQVGAHTHRPSICCSCQAPMDNQCVSGKFAQHRHCRLSIPTVLMQSGCSGYTLCLRTAFHCVHICSLQ